MRTINTYTFEELSPEARITALKAVRKHWPWLSWCDDDTALLTEDFSAALARRGLPSQDVRWRLSYSQGDGVAFYGSDFDLPKLREVLAPKLSDADQRYLGWIERFDIDLDLAIEKVNPRYDHYNSMRLVEGIPEFYAVYPEKPRTARFIERVKTALAEYIIETSRELEADGYRTIEDHGTDDYLTESLLATSDESFTVEGRIINIGRE